MPDKQIQEQYKDGHWETIATCENGYNADAILLALSTKWPNMKHRVI